MIISKTPHRISFFGGGTDYPSYYLKHGGKVLGVGINKYSYINIRRLPPFFEHKHRIVYSKQENVIELDEIVHPSVRETLKFFNVDYGISIHHDGDIPARSGMGSSSAFTVGLIKSLYALEGKMISKEVLAKTAIHIEQNLIQEHVGSQDQMFAAYGGLNMIEFLQSGEIIVNPVILPKNRLEEFEGSLMLFFTGISRIASEVARDQIENIHLNESNLHIMKDLVDDALEILTSEKDLKLFGEMLNETWKLKRSLSDKISNIQIDSMYDTAISAGALGGKLLGAGGGGFMLFFVPKEQQESVKKALHGYLHIPFKFDSGGSEVIVYEPNH
ncbi:MAG: kinase [Sulfuricurvum sp.]|nr:kinase [Sulfuricurvum sp.]